MVIVRVKHMNDHFYQDLASFFMTFERIIGLKDLILILKIDYLCRKYSFWIQKIRFLEEYKKEGPLQSLDY